jgi:hypothetical protein
MKKALLVAVAVVIATAVFFFCYRYYIGVLHVFGVQPTPAGTSSWYQLWSGLIPSLVIFGAVGTFYYQHSCHYHPSCLRWGRYEAGNGMFKFCHKHHPDFGGKRPTREKVIEIHDASC